MASDSMELRAVLAANAVSYAEWTVLDLIGTANGPIYPKWLEHRYAQRARQDASLSSAPFEMVLDACCSKQWAQILDASAIAEIKSVLQADDAPCLSDDWMVLHAVDFTVAGAGLYVRIRDSRDVARSKGTEPLAIYEAYSRRHVYFERETDALAFSEEPPDDASLISISRPVAIGPWCVRWWKHFPSGYLVEVKVASWPLLNRRLRDQSDGPKPSEDP